MNINQIVQQIIQEAKDQGADFCEVMVWRDESALKRIKDGQVDQPPAGEEWGVDLALVKGKKRKTISFDNPVFAREGIRAALTSMQYLPDQEIFLPDESYQAVEQPEQVYDEKTAALDSENSIAIVREVDKQLEQEGLNLSGKIAQGRGELAYGNSLGTRQHMRFTTATAAFFAFGKEDTQISTYANSGGVSIQNIETERLVQELVTKCNLQQGKKRIDLFEGKEDGEDLAMDIIVEPYFFEPIFEWLGFFGFNGLFVEHGESFISGKIGQQVMGENITIKDSPFEKENRGMTLPFDFEGRPREELPLVEKGVARTGVYDTQLARQHHKQPTGNALNPSSRSEGAAPFNLVVEGGDSSIEEMIASSSRPTLWITKLHYLGMKHYQTATMTGVAQHGTFLIENGQVQAPVENLRFEEKIPEALKRVEALSPSRLVFAPMGFGMPTGTVVPAMKIRDFRFVGSTKRTT